MRCVVASQVWLQGKWSLTQGCTALLPSLRYAYLYIRVVTTSMGLILYGHYPHWPPHAHLYIGVATTSMGLILASRPGWNFCMRHRSMATLKKPSVRVPVTGSREDVRYACTGTRCRSDGCTKMSA